MSLQQIKLCRCYFANIFFLQRDSDDKFIFDKSPRLMNFSLLSLCKHFFLQRDSDDKFIFDKSELNDKTVK